MNISILLPYKENYSPTYPGAVSLFVDATSKLSSYKKKITVFGNTEYIKKLYGNYINIKLPKNNFLNSQSSSYVNKFVDLQGEINSDIIEVHNRPNYVSKLNQLKKKIVLYFHNDPLSMLGSKKIKERIFLLNNCERIIFNSQWSKNRFLNNLENIYHKSDRLQVIHQSINKTSVDLKKNKN